MDFKKVQIGILIFAFCVCASAASAAGASLYLSPPSGTYNVDSVFSVKIKVDSGGKVINAAEGTLVFNPNELQIVNISKSDSIFTLWTTEPTFSNSEGSIIFGGGTSSNFIGTSGTIVTISFTAKASASAQMSFSSGSVLAADGKGTNILATMNGGTYTLKPKITIPPAEEVAPEAEYIPTAPTGISSAPNIRSSTHPVADNWYSNNTPEFSWKVPSDVTAVKLLIGKMPTAVPTVLYAPAISEKKIDELPDGVYYFHARFKNQYGWGGITHRKVLIDTVSPASFEILVDNQMDFTNPTPILYFETEDVTSGIGFYEIKIGNADGRKVIYEDIKHNPYKMLPQSPGKYRIIVEAVDRADNIEVAVTEVIIEPLEPPVITDFPKTLRVGGTLSIKGICQARNGVVKVFVKQQGEEPEAQDVKTDQEGNWSFVYPKELQRGSYQIWVELTDSRGAKSGPSDKITIMAALPPFLQFGSIAIDYLAVVITLISLVIVLISVIVFSWFRLCRWRKRLRKETRDVTRVLRKAFNVFEELDKKSRLTKKEKEIQDKLKEAFKEIKDIKKCLQ